MNKLYIEVNSIDNIENWIDYVDEEEIIEKVLETGEEWFDVYVCVPLKYDPKYDEYYTEDIHQGEFHISELINNKTYKELQKQLEEEE